MSSVPFLSFYLSFFVGDLIPVAATWLRSGCCCSSSHCVRPRWIAANLPSFPRLAHHLLRLASTHSPCSHVQTMDCLHIQRVPSVTRILVSDSNVQVSCCNRWRGKEQGSDARRTQVQQDTDPNTNMILSGALLAHGGKLHRYPSVPESQHV